MGWPTGAYYDGSGVTCAVQNDTSRVKANVFAGLYTLASSTNAGCGFDASGYTNSNNTIFAAITGALLNSPYSGVSTGNYSPANFFPAGGSPVETALISHYRV